MAKNRKKLIWKGILLTVLITGALLIALSLYLKHNYKDIMVALIKDEVERHVIPDVYTEIDFTLWRTFPNASVVFKDTRVVDPLAADAYIFRAKGMFFKFNVLDLLRGNYRLTSMEVADGDISLVVNEHGEANFNHLLSPAPDTTAAELQMSLDNIVFKNISVSWQDDKNRQGAQLTINNMRARGQFSSLAYTMSTEGEMVLHKLTDKDFTWSNQDRITMALQMDVSNEEKRVQFTQSRVTFNSLSMDLEGLVGFGQERKADLHMHASRIDIHKLIGDLPEQYGAVVSPYRIDGDGTAHIYIKGSYAVMPHIRSRFSLANGKMEHINSGVALEGLAFKGTFSNGEKNSAATSVLNVEQFQGNFSGQPFSGRFRARELDRPAIELYTKASLDIGKVRDFAGLDTVETAQGQVEADLDFAFKPENIFALQPEDFRDSRANGTVSVRGARIKVKGSQLEARSLSGNLSFTNRDVTVRELRGYINGENDFYIKGSLYNLLPFMLFKNENLHIAADFRSKNLRIDDLLRPEGLQQSQADEYYLDLPRNISFNFAMEAHNIAFRKFRGQNVQGNARMKNQVLYFSQMKMNSMEGEVVGKGTVSAKAGQDVYVNGEAFLHKVQMEQALYQLENLNQEAITHENISGELTSNFQFSARFTRSLKPIQNSFIAQADLKIDNGQLQNFEPLERMARFLNISQLAQVEFKTLENSISLKDMVITIPQMEVRSNAGNMKLRGSHTLDNEVEYYVEMLLSQLLSGIAQRSKPEHSEFGEIRDEGGFSGIKLFIKVHGPLEDPRFSYDAKSLATEVQDGMRAQRQSVRQSLHDELGLFRGDTTLDHREKSERRKEREQRRAQQEEEKARLEKREQGEFIIEWEEE